VRAWLEKDDIEARPTWKPMHQQRAFATCPVVGGAVADRIFAAGLCLPSGSGTTDAELTRVAERILSTPGARR